MNQKRQEYSSGKYSPVLDIKTINQEHCVVINITDNGKGISEDNIKDIFDPFYTTKPAGDGTELGLSLSHEIVVGVHGGEIELKSKEGEFAVFVIKLPRSA